MSGPFDPRMLPPLRSALAGGEWDVVHTHGSRANLPVRVLRLPHPRAGSAESSTGRHCPRYYTTIHSDLLLDYRSRLRASVYGVFDRATLVAVDGIVCVSEDLRRRLVGRGYPTAKLLVVRPGLELDPNRPLPGQRAAWMRDSASAPGAAQASDPELPEAMARIDAPNARWAGTVARLVGVKDIDLMLRSFARVAAEMPTARLAVVGDGPDGPGLRRRRCRWGLPSGWHSPDGCPAYGRRCAGSRSIGLPLSPRGCRCLLWKRCPPDFRWWPRRWEASRRSWKTAYPVSWCRAWTEKRPQQLWPGASRSCWKIQICAWPWEGPGRTG